MIQAVVSSFEGAVPTLPKPSQGLQHSGKRDMQLHSTIDPTSSEFARNADVMRGLVAELREKLKLVSGGGGEASRKRHTSRGKMLARERVDLLVDPGTAFLELSPLAANGLYGGDVHSASCALT